MITISPLGTPIPIWWDNFKVTHTSSGAIQKDDYYPFGLRHNKSVADENINSYLYNGGTELNTTTGLYMTPFRRYDPATGRFNGVDAMASSYTSMTPYQYGFNNPISFNDPTGLYPTCETRPHHQPEWVSDWDNGVYSNYENIQGLAFGPPEHWYRESMFSKIKISNIF